MRRVLLILLTVFLGLLSNGQSIVNRSNSVVTVQDARWAALYNAFLPRYLDTTAANIQSGIDSCGAIIFTYSNNTAWIRGCSPKRWIDISSSTTGQRFAVAGEDATATQSRFFDGDRKTFIMDTMGTFRIRTIETDGTRYFFEINTTLNKMYYGDYNSATYLGEASIGEDGFTGGYINMYIGKQGNTGYGVPQINLAGGDSSIQISSNKIIINADSSISNSGVYLSRIPYSASTSYSSLLRDASNGKMYLTPQATWQRTLDVGSTLNKENTVNGGGFDLHFSNIDTLHLRGSVSSSDPATFAIDSVFYISRGTGGETGRVNVSVANNQDLLFSGTTVNGAIWTRPYFAGAFVKFTDDNALSTGGVIQSFHSTGSTSHGVIGILPTNTSFYLTSRNGYQLDIFSPYTRVLPASASTSDSVLVVDASTGQMKTRAQSAISGGGVNALAAIGSSPNANGATISGTTLNLEPASASFGGVVTTGTQTFAGAKTFNSTSGVTIVNNNLGPYTSSSANDALKLQSNSSGATFAVQNNSGTGFSGIEYFNNAGAVSVFTGFNNGVAGEFRFNNIASSGHIRFMIAGTDGLRINNSREILINNISDQGNFNLQVSGNTYISGNTGIGNTSPATLLHIGTAGSSLGGISVTGNTSGTISLLPQAAAGTYNWNWPTTSGSSGEALLSGGGGSTAMTWLALAGSSTTPTLINGTNVDASTAYEIHWTRAGSTVTFSGTIDIDATAGSSATVVDISLPVASNFAATTNATGTSWRLAAPTTVPTGFIVASVANDRLVLTLTSDGTANVTYGFSGSYKIL